MIIWLRLEHTHKKTSAGLLGPGEERNKEEGGMDWTQQFEVQQELKPCGKFSPESQGTKLLYYFSVNKLIEIIKQK